MGIRICILGLRRVLVSTSTRSSSGDGHTNKGRSVHSFGRGSAPQAQLASVLASLGPTTNQQQWYVRTDRLKLRSNRQFTNEVSRRRRPPRRSMPTCADHPPLKDEKAT